MKQNKKTINEAQLRAIVSEAVKSVLNEKYNPWKRVEDKDGEISFPRYDKDTQPYQDRLAKQAAHLYKQIEFFLQTLEHAHPNMPNAKEYNDYHRSIGGWGGDSQKVEDCLERAKVALHTYMDSKTIRGFDRYGVN